MQNIPDSIARSKPRSHRYVLAKLGLRHRIPIDANFQANTTLSRLICDEIGLFDIPYSPPVEEEVIA